MVNNFLKGEIGMTKFNENGFSINPENETIQEGFDAGTSGFTDMFGGKFDYPGNLASNNSQLKSGMFPDMVEDGPNAIGYNNKAPGFEPNPGKFFDPDTK